MYRRLDPELEEIIGHLKIGDGIIIEHRPGHYADRSIGYVYSIKPTYLTLTATRNATFWLEKISQFFTKTRRSYGFIDNITVVDPISRS